MPSLFEDSDPHGRVDDRSRRQFVLGVAATALLAGCPADDGRGTGTADDRTDGTPTPEPDAGTAPTPPADDGSDTGATDDQTDGTPTPEPDAAATTATDDGGNESLSRAQARDLLPMESLAFRYMPPHGSQFGRFWTAVVGETDAAAVRAEAESGHHSQAGPREGTIDDYFAAAVRVDPDGDEVTAFAVDENGARGPVATSPVPADDLTTAEAEQAVPSEALSFTYEPPSTGDYGDLTIEVTGDTTVDTLVAQPQEAPGLFADRVGDLADEERVGAGTTLEVAVDPDGDEVIVWASVDGATGEVTRWMGPD